MAQSGKEVHEFLQSFDAGMNADLDPLLLERNQLALGRNLTVRTTFANPRARYRKVAITYDDSIQAAASQSLWQNCTYYKPDGGAAEYLSASIAGRLFKFTPGSGATATCAEITGGNAQSSTAVQACLFQAENYIFWFDGVSLPVFFNGSTTARSAGSGTIFNTTTTALIASWPAIGLTTPMPVTSEANMTVGDILTISNVGSVIVTSLGPLVVTNQTIPEGTVTQIGVAVTWQTGGFQFPICSIGVYGLGRVWAALADGFRFVAGDIVGGSSGTVANQFRDAILYVRENTFLLGGGYFRVPGDAGEIRAMRFAATLDASLGQGPLQIYTPNIVFSCQAPVDRESWTVIANPILTESLISNGAQGQDSTNLANGDTLFRSVDGKRSLILGRRDFATWGNVPISQEVDPLISRDNPALLRYGSSIIFDNRELSTYSPIQGTLGVYHTGLIALNFDPISTLRGKEPSVYDGTWDGLNVLRLVKGIFASVERAFAFCLNDALDTIELWEILPSSSMLLEDDGCKVQWDLRSAALFNRDRPISERELVRLIDGEIFVDNLRGQVKFEAFYKPDQYVDWVPWSSWIESYDPALRNGFRPRMGLGMPNPNVFDEGTNRPLREAYNFQFRLLITGYCHFKGCKLKGVTIPEQEFATPRDNGTDPFSQCADLLAMANDAQTASTMIGTVSNSNGITIPTIIGSATPYPSTGTFSGSSKSFTVDAGAFTSELSVDSSLTLDERNALIAAEQGRLNALALDSARTQLMATIRITVSITSLTHSAPDDVQIMLSSPGSVKVTLMRHCGGSNSITGVSLTFDDSASSLPASTIITTGTYKPTLNGVSGFSVFPGPPSGTEYDVLSQFLKGDLNGTWNMWVIDLVNADGGSIGAWSLTIT